MAHMSSATARELDDLIAEITMDSNSEDERCRASRLAFENDVRFPLSGIVVGEGVQVLSVGLGHGRRELIATCDQAGRAEPDRRARRRAAGQCVPPLARPMTGRKTTAWEIASDEVQVMLLRRLLDGTSRTSSEADQSVLTVLENVEHPNVVAWERLLAKGQE